MMFPLEVNPARFIHTFPTGQSGNQPQSREERTSAAVTLPRLPPKCPMTELLTAAVCLAEYAAANGGIVSCPPGDPILMPSSTVRTTFVPAGSFTLRDPRS